MIFSKNLFFIILKSFFFRTESEKVSWHCLLQLTHVVNSRLKLRVLWIPGTQGLIQFADHRSIMSMKAAALVRGKQIWTFPLNCRQPREHLGKFRRIRIWFFDIRKSRVNSHMLLPLRILYFQLRIHWCLRNHLKSMLNPLMLAG